MDPDFGTFGTVPDRCPEVFPGRIFKLEFVTGERYAVGNFN